MDKDLEDIYNKLVKNKDAGIAMILADAAEIMQAHDMIASYMQVHDVQPACMAAACKLLYDQIIDQGAKAAMKQLPVPGKPESKEWNFSQCKEHVMMSVDNMAMILRYFKDVLNRGKDFSKMSTEELDLVARELKTKLKGIR